MNNEKTQRTVEVEFNPIVEFERSYDGTSVIEIDTCQCYVVIECTDINWPISVRNGEILWAENDARGVDGLMTDEIGELLDDAAEKVDGNELKQSLANAIAAKVGDRRVWQQYNRDFANCYNVVVSSDEPADLGFGVAEISKDDSLWALELFGCGNDATSWYGSLIVIDDE